MKITEHDIHITEKIGKPYFKNGNWVQNVIAIVNYKEERHHITHPNYDMIIALQVGRLSKQQPVYISNVSYV